MKAEPSRLIPGKFTEDLKILIVFYFPLNFFVKKVFFRVPSW